MNTIHNGCIFQIVRYYANKAVIKITPINGVFTSGESCKYVTENITDLTTNGGGGFTEWIKNNF